MEFTHERGGLVEKMLGQILVERNIISPGHLQMALDRQKKEKRKCKYIGEILLRWGFPRKRSMRPWMVRIKGNR